MVYSEIDLPSIHGLHLGESGISVFINSEFVIQSVIMQIDITHFLRFPCSPPICFAAFSNIEQ